MLYPAQRTTYLDSNVGTYVTCSDRVDPLCSRESERRKVTHCKAVSETAGSDGSCVQCDTSWPAVLETSTVVAQDQGVFAVGKPASHDQGQAAVPMCLRHVETTLVPHRLGSGHEWSPCPQSVEWSPSHVAYLLYQLVITSPGP